MNGLSKVGLALSLAAVWVGFAAEAGTIVSVGRRLRMSNSEPPPPKDFFIDMGRREGVKEGDVFTVSRQLAVVHDRMGSPQPLIRIALGEIVIQAVGEGGSFARQASIKAPSELPFMDSPSFMVGDEVQTKSGLPFR